MTLHYRRALLPDDAALLLDLNAEYLEYVFAGVAARHPVTLADVFPGGDIRAYLPTVLDKIVGPGPPESLFLILEDEGRPVGMGGVRPLRPGVCELKRIYLRDAVKGRGAGRALVTHLMGWARDAGYATMFLDTAPTLTAAIALYEQLGFSRIPAYPEVEVPPIMHAHWIFMARQLQTCGDIR